MQNILYHGSNVVVEKPHIITDGNYKEFVDGLISREAFWVLVKFKYPTHQMAFCTQEALETISFEGSEDCEE